MSRGDHRQLLIDERHDLAEFLSELDDPDWDHPSLCSEWTVLEVAAHLSSVIGLTRGGLVKRNLRYGSGTDGANARTARAFAAKGREAIVASIDDERALGLGFIHPAWALCETIVHHQDMRRPLGRNRTLPAERLEVAARILFKVPMLTGASRQSRRITLAPTDADWTVGTGPEVSGPGEALLMALAGRTVAFDELTGPGVEILVDGTH